MIKLSTIAAFSVGFLLGNFIGYFMGWQDYHDTYVEVTLVASVLSLLVFVIAARAWFGYKEVF